MASRRFSTIGWWTATLATLVILDDLTFGPVFWLISLFGSPIAGFAVALAIYVPAQVLLVRAGTSDDPHPIARWFLDRLDLARRFDGVAQREKSLRSRVTGGASACLLSLVIGGVIPPMVLWRQGHSQQFVRRLSLATATIYALEFALLHGLMPGTVI